MGRVCFRFLCVIGVSLLGFELIERLSVSRPESWGERAMLLLMGLTAVGLVWAVKAAFATLKYRNWYRAALFAALVMITHLAVQFYSWHLRPNLGWYEEPHWVSKFPEFQKEHRKRIERNLW